MQATLHTLLLTRKYLILLDTKSVFHFYELNDKLECQNDASVSEFKLINGEMSNVLLDHDCHEIFAIVDGHKVLKASLPEEKNEDQEDEQKDGSRVGIYSKSFQLSYELLGHFHTGEIVGCFFINEDRALATFSRDGNYLVWDCASRKSVFHQSLEFEIHTIAFEAKTQTFYLGCSEGVVRRAVLAGKVVGETASFRLVHDNPVERISLSGVGTGACLIQNTKEIFLFRDMPDEVQVLGTLGLNA